jgi:hypothetical protein
MMWNPFRPQPAAGERQNYVLLTYDSCRMDTYDAANTPVLDERVEMRRAWAQATYTYPSHASMFQGMLPHAFTDEPYYNRFVRQLWRQPHRKRGATPAVRLPPGSKSIMDGFNRLGYFTCGTAAMGWFRTHKQLREHWQAFTWTGIAARQQVEWTLDQLRRNPKRPFFAFINFGETHSPFHFDIAPGSEGDAAARKRGRSPVPVADWKFDDEAWRKQVTCLEYLDARTGDLLNGLSELGRDALVVACSDHGECFGEEGQYGHGFYHPRIMEVPMGIFVHRADGTIDKGVLPIPEDAA